ncbi:uncharacterized protein LOC127520846 isoform X2 [Ctenopharyngodon idella]|uniref:uncharacterized protein LOC127520846 isoform X2 n=1 Tax=Ctenopharyngodon idella TaxID=7959 RepID=UPI00222F3908|nr:uncharacterized protein LOC127520846 isoform X2 [Ctenopharyngodon idella]
MFQPVFFCLCLWCVVGVFGDTNEIVTKGHPVTLNSDLTEMKDDDVIQWRFGNTLIAEISKRPNRFTVYDDVLDGRFRDRLKLDNQTGSLTITDITMKHDGHYQLKINSVVENFTLIVCDEITVNERGSTTINTSLIKIMDDDVIQWRFGYENTLIAEINKRNHRITVNDDVLDGRFRDRLKLDNQTGSLTITNITTEHAGVYELKINRVRKSFLLTVIGVKSVSVMEGDSVTLNSGLTEMKDDDAIRWKFEKYFIAEINKQDGSITVHDDVPDGRFRDRLKLDNQTGSLTITNTRTEHTGHYEVLNTRMIISFILIVYGDAVSVTEGDSVTLNSDLTEIMDDHQWIQWSFGIEYILIAEINQWANRITVYDGVLDGRFRDRLKLDNQTGSLTITNTTTEHAGVYLLQITGAKDSLKAFRVFVYDSVHCCGSTEAVIRLVLSALVGVATVILLVYDIRSRRAEQDQEQIHTSGSIEI